MRYKQNFWICISVVFLFAVVCQISLGNQEDSQTPNPDAPNPIIKQILITIHQPEAPKDELAEIANNLISLKKGEPFSSEKLQQSIDALKLSNHFRKIDVDSEENHDGMILSFRLTPSQWIKDVKVTGEYPLFEREVLNTMTIFTGDAFLPETLVTQQELIESIYKREGYIDPKVSVTAEEDPDDCYFKVLVKIHKGTYYKLNQLKIAGNKFRSTVSIKLKFGIYRRNLFAAGINRFIDKDLQSDIKKLIQFYRKNGYADVEIDSKVETNPDTGNVNVSVKIEEGKRYEIKFKGRQKFWKRTLKKDLVLFKQGNKSDMGLRKSAREIKNRYHQAGFHDTKVTFEDLPAVKVTQRSIQLNIDEGPCSIIKNVRISGNRFFKDSKIIKQMLTRKKGMIGVFWKGILVPEVLEEDILAIRSLYLKNGYLDIEVANEISILNVDKKDNKKYVDLTLNIDEGQQTKVSSVNISKITVVPPKKVSKTLTLKASEPYRKYMVQSDENALSMLLSEKGYPHVVVKGRVIKEKTEPGKNKEVLEEDTDTPSKTVQVTYDVDEGPFVEMGEIYFSGNFRTKERFLKKELGINPGEPFSLKKMLEGQQEIRALDIFNSVHFKTIGLKEKNDKVHLFADMEENKPYYLQAGGGFETNKGLYANAKAGDYNLFGTNKHVWTSGEMSETGHEGVIGITEPRVFGTKTSANFTISTKKEQEFNKSFSVRTYGPTISFNRKLTKHIKASLTFKYEQRITEETGPVDDATYESGDFSDDPRSLVVTTPTIFYDTRDSFVRPRKGIYSAFSIDLSRGIENSLDDFYKYRFDFRFYFTPLDRLTFACMGKTGHMDTTRSRGIIPEDQLFFLGGTTTVRGFKENMLAFDINDDTGNSIAIGGRTGYAGSIEARIDLGRNFEMAAFFDTGSLQNTRSTDYIEDFQSSYGLGLRFMTPIGPIGLLHGFKIDPREGEGSDLSHFSIGYTF